MPRQSKMTNTKPSKERAQMFVKLPNRPTMVIRKHGEDIDQNDIDELMYLSTLKVGDLGMLDVDSVDPALSGAVTVDTWTGKPYRPLPGGAPFAGLNNQGATCYMNSILQCLFMTKELRLAIFTWRYDPGRDGVAGEAVAYQLQRLFSTMQQHPGECATTEPLSEAFGWVGPEQGPAAEQDCKEFMSLFVDTLKHEWKGSPQRDVLAALFSGVDHDASICAACGIVSGPLIPMVSMVIELKKWDEARCIRSLEERLHDRAHGEELVEGCFCNSCGADPVILKKFNRVQELPLVLRLSLERLVTDFNNVPVKLADSVSFPLELDMAPYLPAAVRCTMNGSKTMYDCYAVGVHRGGADEGHYYAYCRDFMLDKWFEFNDRRVVEVDPCSAEIQDIFFKTAVFVWYRRRGPENVDAVPAEEVPSVPAVAHDKEVGHLHCRGAHAVDGRNGCHNEACRGRRWCARECTGCPDVQDRSIKTAHDAHQPDVDLEVPETRLRPCTVASAETTTRTAVPVVAAAAPTPTLPTGGGGGNGYLDSLRGMGAAELVAMLGAKSLGMFGTTNQPVNEPSNPRAAHDHRTPPQHTQAAVGDTMCILCGFADKGLGAKKLLRCARCKTAFYCGRECQKKHWKDHKKVCMT